jgi:hypothetical protein
MLLGIASMPEFVKNHGKPKYTLENNSICCYQASAKQKIINSTKLQA